MLDHNTLPQFKKVDEEVFFKLNIMYVLILRSKGYSRKLQYSTVLLYIKLAQILLY